MRLVEIASAEEQIELWKLVSNSVWQSLQQQQHEEQQRKAASAVKKRVATKGSERVGSAPVIPSPTPLPTLNKPSTKSAHPNANQRIPSAVKPVPSATLSAASAQPNALQQSASAQAKSLKSAASTDNRLASLQSKSDEEKTDRHSENTLPSNAENSSKRR